MMKLKSLLTGLLSLVMAMTFGQLTGNLSIGPAGDYTTMALAFADMQAQGVTGSLVFTVEAGTYDEQLNIDGSTIAGLSGADITFLGGDVRENVVWTFNADAATDKFTLKLTNFSNLTFRQMTLLSETVIGDVTVISGGGGLSNITFDDCVIEAETAGVTDFGALVDWFSGGDYNDITITGCSFINSFRGLTIVDGGGYVIQNNEFVGQFKQSLSLGEAEGIQYDHNTITIDSNSADGYTFGLEIWNSGDFVVENSSFLIDAGEAALRMDQDYLADSTRNGVINNYFELNDDFESVNAIYVTSSADVDVFHNSIKIVKGGNGMLALSVTDLEFYNNNVLHLDGGRIFFTSGSGSSFAARITSDNNNLFTEGDYSVFASSFTEFQLESGQDANSVSYETPFRMDGAPDICHYGLYRAGKTGLGVMEDYYDLAVDDSNPDIGAYAFDLPNVDILTVTDTTLCENDSLRLDAGAGYSSYWWSTGDSVQIEYINEANGAVYVEVYDDVTDCLLGDSVNVYLDDAHVDLGVDSLICQGTEMQLYVENQFRSIEWSTGATDTSIIITSAGEYWIRTVDSVNCVEFDTMNLALSTATIEPNFLVGAEACVDDTVFFFDVTSITADVYDWDFGGSGNSAAQYPWHQFSTAGSYDILMTVDYQDCIGKEIEKTITVVECVGPEMEEASSIFGEMALFPNPNSGDFELNVELTREVDVELKMVGLDGLVVIEEYFNAVEHIEEAYSLRNITVGFYVLNVFSEGEVVKIKVLIQ